MYNTDYFTRTFGPGMKPNRLQKAIIDLHNERRVHASHAIDYHDPTVRKYLKDGHRGSMDKCQRRIRYLVRVIRYERRNHVSV